MLSGLEKNVDDACAREEDAWMTAVWLWARRPIGTEAWRQARLNAHGLTEFNDALTTAECIRAGGDTEHDCDATEEACAWLFDSGYVYIHSIMKNVVRNSKLTMMVERQLQNQPPTRTHLCIAAHADAVQWFSSILHMLTPENIDEALSMACRANATNVATCLLSALDPLEDYRAEDALRAAACRGSRRMIAKIVRQCFRGCVNWRLLIRGIAESDSPSRMQDRLAVYALRRLRHAGVYDDKTMCAIAYNALTTSASPSVLRTALSMFETCAAQAWLREFFIHDDGDDDFVNVCWHKSESCERHILRASRGQQLAEFCTYSNGLPQQNLTLRIEGPLGTAIARRCRNSPLAVSAILERHAKLSYPNNLRRTEHNFL